MKAFLNTELPLASDGWRTLRVNESRISGWTDGGSRVVPRIISPHAQKLCMGFCYAQPLQRKINFPSPIGEENAVVTIVSQKQVGLKSDSMYLGNVVRKERRKA